MRLPSPFLVGVILPPISHARDLIRTSPAMFLSTFIKIQNKKRKKKEANLNFFLINLNMYVPAQ